ncbi:MAG TPA: hypothetical protein DDW57_06380 [Erysipelotrichaceae bacterium]|nr:hypothetical protein [Erysipelotrichaceae bacterium]
MGDRGKLPDNEERAEDKTDVRLNGGLHKRTPSPMIHVAHGLPPFQEEIPEREIHMRQSVQHAS